ncbi:CMP-N-acetylneuraminate-beta-galactosamide-alpha-2,3-sialyltransferase 1 [Leptodactylus fuscus]|uniref:CMP-N-acetylneuraminate-beta-galactosamide- alpha-2,3-sialyltransferase 1 n=1 Tax=Leptodactylus fuscus TaxID=238119 RepID=UPI003F4EAEBB
MVSIRHRNLKLFTIVLAVFTITAMSFLFNYTQNSVLLWNPEKYWLSERIIRFMTSVRRPCSCKTCVSKTEVSPWFDERFNISFPPIMTKQNNMVSGSTYKWWMKLQDEKNPADLNKVIEELFNIIPGDSNVLDHNPSRCRTCAVVGNSGNLKGSEYGQDIDAHDFVLRMNQGPTAKYEKDVGNKTTHHFVYPESMRDLQEDVSMVLIPFKILDLQWVVSALTTGSISFTYAPVPRKIKVNKDKILVYHPEFMRYVNDRWLFNHGRYSSTGLLTVIFALHICDQVDLYGFGADSKGNWHHYWENNASAGAFIKTGVHDGNFEAEILGNLTSIQKIRIFRGR